jgi:hypothetical protein
VAIALDDSRLFDTWDRAASLARPWRELALLESASGIPANELARLTIGERDRLLLALRIGTFGNRLECETRCPECDTRLELAFDASNLLTPIVDIAESDLEIATDAWTVRFRLPDSNDIAAALGGEDLSDRLVTVIPKPASVIPSEARDRSPGGAVRQLLPENDPSLLSLRGMTEERIAALDPQADISLDLSCAACGHRWQAPFDPAAFLFREVEAAVGRLTNEVHQLARAYAWSEESILAMGATRRRRYLNLVSQ